MFIKIPEDFFIPIVFSDDKILFENYLGYKTRNSDDDILRFDLHMEGVKCSISYAMEKLFIRIQELCKYMKQEEILEYHLRLAGEIYDMHMDNVVCIQNKVNKNQYMNPCDYRKKVLKAVKEKYLEIYRKYGCNKEKCEEEMPKEILRKKADELILQFKNSLRKILETLEDLDRERIEVFHMFFIRKIVSLHLEFIPCLKEIDDKERAILVKNTVEELMSKYKSISMVYEV